MIPSRTSTALFFRRAWLPLLVAAVLRLGVAFTLDAPLVHDQKDYYRLAVSMANGRGYVVQNGNPTAYRPVGYPAFLAGTFSWFGTNPRSARVVQALLSILSVLALGVTAYRIGGHGPMMRALWLGALYPADILYVATLYGETFFIALQWALILLLWPWLEGEREAPTPNLPIARGILAGLVGGWIALTKAYGLVLLPILLIIAAYRQGPRRKLLTVTVSSLIIAWAIAGTWIVRNDRVVGAANLTTNAGANLWVGNNPRATGGYFWHDTPKPLPKAEPAADKMLRQAAIGAVLRNPLSTVLRIPMKLAYTLRSDGDVLVELFARRRARTFREALAEVPLALRVLIWIFHATVFAAGWSAWWFWRKAPWRTWSAAIVLLNLALTAVFFGMPRFHIPLVPLALLAAALLPVRHEQFYVGSVAARLTWAVGFLFLLAIWGMEAMYLFSA